MQEGATLHSTRDFAPLAVAFEHPFVVLGPMTGPGANIKEMIGHAKANPDKPNFATLGGFPT